VSGMLAGVSGREAVRRFEQVGWKLTRVHGSHAILVKPDTHTNLAIPLHEELGIGILRRLIHLAGMTPEEFERLCGTKRCAR
jgi:predicted RNA binding protein YcfA (HicA-like mRNA interferase family)